MRFLINSLFLTFFCATLSGQSIYLQLEEINTFNSYQYYPGDKIEFSTKDYPNTWRKDRIQKIMPEDGLIILSEGYMTTDDFHSIRRSNTAVLVVGTALGTFGTTWLGFGLLGTLGDSDFTLGGREITIGVVAVTLGWVMRKFFGKKRNDLGSLYKLRIIDVRMF